MFLLLPSQYDEGDAEITVARWDVQDGELLIELGGVWKSMSLGWAEVRSAESSYTCALSMRGITFYEVSPVPWFPDFDDYGITVNGETIAVNG